MDSLAAIQAANFMKNFYWLPKIIVLLCGQGNCFFFLIASVDLYSTKEMLR
jgi:hypothetical protein